MKYPKEFIDKCHAMFPEWVDLHISLKNGSAYVGSHLCDMCVFSVDEDMVISSFRNKKEKRILELAIRTQQIRELYREWFSIMESHEKILSEQYGYEDCI